MAKRTLEKKDFYTEEELMTLKMPKTKTYEDDFLNNLYNIMFKRVGRSYEWAKAHDREDLHVIDIVAFPSEKAYDDFREVLVKIIRKQLGFTKKESEKEASWFNFAGGLTFYNNPEIDGEQKPLTMSEDNFKEGIRNHIKRYEERNGELKYDDGYEVELKAYCGYGFD